MFYQIYSLLKKAYQHYLNRKEKQEYENIIDTLHDHPLPEKTHQSALQATLCAVSEGGKSVFVGLVGFGTLRIVFDIAINEKTTSQYVSALLILMGINTVAGFVRQHYFHETVHHTAPQLNLLETAVAYPYLASLIVDSHPKIARPLFTGGLILGSLISGSQLLHPDVPLSRFSYTQRNSAVQGTLYIGDEKEPTWRPTLRFIVNAIGLQSSSMITFTSLWGIGDFVELGWPQGIEAFFIIGLFSAVIDFLCRVFEFKTTASPDQPTSPTLFELCHWQNTTGIFLYTALQLYVVWINLEILLWKGPGELTLYKHPEFLFGNLALSILISLFAAQDAHQIYNEEIIKAGKQYNPFQRKLELTVDEYEDLEKRMLSAKSRFNFFAHDIPDDSAKKIPPTNLDIMIRPRMLLRQ